MMELVNDKVIRDQLKAAAKDSDVKAVILKVDSPGGEVLASDEIYKEIENFQKKTHKPVVASMGTLAASGGYYISAPCRWIVANELTITGSIGVIMHGYNYRGLMNKIGLKPEVFKSGKFKDMLSGEKETDPEKVTPAEAKELAQERQMVQGLINETYDRFKTIVKKGRATAHKENGNDGRELAEDWADYADGRVMSGKQAYDLGFVDELGNFSKAIERTETLSNISGKATLVEYQKPFDISLLFRLLGKGESQTLKVDFAGVAPKLKAGLLYYILPTVLH
jgi:protease-4